MIRARLTAALLLLPLAACVVPSPVALPERPPRDIATPVVATPPVAGYRPAACDNRRPAARDPFPYNRNIKTRDAYVQFYPDPEPAYESGEATFDNLDAGTLAALIEERYADPDGAQNLAPDLWAVFAFMCDHPEVRAAGYAVSLDRPDYRIGIDTVYAEEITATLREDAEDFCADADEQDVSEHFVCWWD